MILEYENILKNYHRNYFDLATDLSPVLSAEQIRQELYQYMAELCVVFGQEGEDESEKKENAIRAIKVLLLFYENLNNV